jgi:hypothetical protein
MRNKFLHWSPRILALLFIVFLSIFALDVFDEYHELAVLPALFMHLLIPLTLLISVILAWKWDLFMAIIFFAFTFFYVWMVGFDRHWSWYVAISGPALLTAILFLLNWLDKKIKK